MPWVTPPSSTPSSSVIASDDFNAGTGTLWGALQNGTTSTACGSITGDAPLFRRCRTALGDHRGPGRQCGGSVQFVLKIGDGVAPCERGSG